MTNEEFKKIEEMMDRSVEGDNIGVLSEDIAGYMSKFYNNLYNMDDYFKEELTIMYFDKLMYG